MPKHQVTFTFPTQELLEEFCGYMSDGGGELGVMDAMDNRIGVNVILKYNRCFPAHGWKEGTPRYIDIIIKED